MTPDQRTRLQRLSADLATLVAEIDAEPCFTDDGGCFTGDPASPQQPAPPVPAQGHLLGLTSRPTHHRSAVHGWGILSDEEHEHPFRPGERVPVRVQPCRHCCARRRYGNTGRRLGTRTTYQEPGGATWSDVMPPCVPKGRASR